MNFSVSFDEMFTMIDTMEVYPLKNSHKVEKFCFKFFLKYLFILICLFSQVCAEKSLSEIAKNVNKMLKFVCDFHVYLKKFQRSQIDQNLSDLHRMQKIVMLLVQNFISKSIRYAKI